MMMKIILKIIYWQSTIVSNKLNSLQEETTPTKWLKLESRSLAQAVRYIRQTHLFLKSYCHVEYSVKTFIYTSSLLAYASINIHL